LNNLTIYACLYLLLFYGAYKILTSETEIKKQTSTAQTVAFFVLTVAVTLLKIRMSATFYGHSSDMSLFSAWTYIGEHEHVREFYGVPGANYHVDYPPLYLYVLTIIGRCASLFSVHYGNDAYITFIKSVPILADTATALIVYWLAKKRFQKKTAGILSVLLLLNPAYILNSVFWGQIDSFYTLIILWLVFALYKKNYKSAVPALAAGMLTKPQMIIFLPLFGFFLLKDAIFEYKEEKRFDSAKDFLWGVLIAVLFTLVLIVPMFGLDIERFIAVYTSAAGKYPYASLNASNIFGAFGLNWANYHETFLGISYKNWGFIGIIFTSLAVGAGTFLSNGRKSVFALSGLTVFGIYMTAHMMHERYSFALVLLLLVTFVITRDKRMLYGFCAASVLTFAQTGAVLLDTEGISRLSSAGFIAFSWAHLALFGYLLVVWYKMLINDETKELSLKPAKILCIHPNEKGARYTKREIVLVLALTVFYGIFAFWNLGTTAVPENGYTPETNGETIVFDLGEEVTINRVNLYAGWMDRRASDSDVRRDLSFAFGIDVSEDSTNGTLDLIFGDEIPFTLDSVFRWHGFFAEQTGRFVTLTVDEGNCFINEIAFYDGQQNLITPVGIYTENQSAKNLIDEQDKAVYEYSFLEGTYFDEVYHPRTAYEYINGLEPYENTHPPLGKLIISLGMLLFGVNPFGWRFFGTLSGVLMVPIGYALARRLLKDKKWAYLATFIFTFDFMHLSQTRLATIDSFTAFMAILMYYFMYRYIKMNFYNTPVKKTLPPLLLSGICFGIGIAIKWQGVYAGIGLAVLFFHSLSMRYLEFCAAKEGRLIGDAEKVLSTFVPKLVKTLLCAVVFFIIIPFAIYFLSYLPIMIKNPEGISYFWNNQQSMLNYHGTLTETHSYGSSWWTWPLDLRPLYAYAPNRDFVPEGISQGISSFGNPLLWWLTIPSVLYLLYRTATHKGTQETQTILTGFFALYLPWIVISRQAFIYHFFPCVFFVALAIACSLKDLTETHQKLRRYVWIYPVCVLVLFIVFYPVLTGIPVPTWYAAALSWLPGWVLG